MKKEIIVIRKLCESHDDDVRGCEIKKRKKEKKRLEDEIFFFLRDNL